MKRVLILLLVLFFLTGCLPKGLDTLIPSATIAPSPTIEISPTLLSPTETPAPTATSTPEPTATLAPTATVPNRSALTAEALADIEVISFNIKNSVQEVYWPTEDIPYLGFNGRLHLLFIDIPALSSPTQHLYGYESVSWDGSHALHQSGSGGLFLLDLTTGKDEVVEQAGAPLFVNFSQDGNWFLLGAQDEIAIDIRDTKTMQRVARLSGFETAAPVYGGSLGPGGKTLAWVSRAALQFQDVASGALGEKYMFEDFIGSSAFSPDGTIFGFSVGNAVKMVDVSIEDSPKVIELGSASGDAVAGAVNFTPDGKVFAASMGSRIVFWDTGDWRRIGDIGIDGTSHLLSFSPAGTWLITQVDDQPIEVRAMP